MKKPLKPNRLPVVTAVLGGIALVLRWLLYAVAVDEKNLLAVNHPLEIGLWVLSGAALVLIAASVWKLEGTERYGANFFASFPAFLGHTAAAVGILVTTLLNEPGMSGPLGTVWKVLGYGAPVCLVLAGLARWKGKQPFFLLHTVVCLYFAVHVVNHYQLWCSNPQIQDYIFALLGTVALCLFGFYCAAFAVNMGKRRMQLGMGLAAVYLCAAEMAATVYPYLYLGGMIWAYTGLCSVYPRPKRVTKEE